MLCHVGGPKGANAIARCFSCPAPVRLDWAWYGLLPRYCQITFIRGSLCLRVCCFRVGVWAAVWLAGRPWGVASVIASVSIHMEHDVLRSVSPVTLKTDDTGCAHLGLLTEVSAVCALQGL